MDLAEAERFLSDVDTVECCFPDTWGVFVGRRMPTAVFLRGGRAWDSACRTLPFAWNIRGDIDPVPYANADTGFPNMHVVPDLVDAPAGAVGRPDRVLPDGRVHRSRRRAASARHTRDLRRAVAALDAVGYEAWVAPELEFYLMHPRLAAAVRRPPVLVDDARRGARAGHRGDPLDAARARASRSSPARPRAGPGQWEINVGPASPIETADNAAILKYVVKLVARRHGLLATFMPMPFQDVEGSGHHLHESLRARGLRRRNVFAEDRQASFDARYLAGVLEHMADLTAVNLPSVNAYKRLKDYTFAPNRVSLGDRQPHRGGADPRRRAGTPPARDPHGLLGREPVPDRGRNDRGGRRRHRATVHAAAADRGRRVQGRYARAPARRTLGAAVDRFERSAFCKDVFGDVFVETFSLLRGARRRRTGTT